MVRPRDYSAGRTWMGAGHTGDPLSDDARYAKPDITRRPPIAIDQALYENCGISGKRYFVAVLHDDGTMVTTYSAPHRMPDQAIPTFFNEEKFVQWAQNPGFSAVSPSFETPGPDYCVDGYGRHIPGTEFLIRTPHVRRRPQGIDGPDTEMAGKTRKRQRAGLYRRGMEAHDDEPRAPVSNVKKPLRIGEPHQILEIYDQRFRSLQQTACKIIAKAWVKLVEPKKQSTHPYTGMEARQPNWWPIPWGPGEKDKVRHKEPDHLWKFERLHLLAHILRMIVEPNNSQHPDIRKLNLTVQKLEEVTNETLSSFFADKMSPQNAKKRKYLAELFKVAKAEERLRNGELDADSVIWVTSDDKIPDEDDEARDARVDEDPCPAGPSVLSTLKPESSSGMLTSPNSDHSAALHETPFLDSIPVRTGQFPSMLPPGISAGQHGYVESGAMGPGSQGSINPSAGLPMQDLCTPPHDGSRRSSFLGTAGDYGAASTNSIYNPGWPTQGTTTAGGGGSSTMYAFTTHQQPPSQPQMPFLPQPGVPMTGGAGGHQYMDSSSFDGLPRATYDQTPNGVFRSDVGGQEQQHQHNQHQQQVATHTQGFPGYVTATTDGRGMSAVHVKDDLDRAGLQ